MRCQPIVLFVPAIKIAVILVQNKRATMAPETGLKMLALVSNKSVSEDFNVCKIW